MSSPAISALVSRHDGSGGAIPGSDFASNLPQEGLREHAKPAVNLPRRYG
jgi:hypothetical protein